MRSKLFGMILSLLFITSFGVCQAFGAEFSVTVKNLTNGTWFTQLLITTHDRHTDLFETGETATKALQAMAEGGDLSGLLIYLDGQGADSVAKPADGLLAPGESVDDVFFDTGRSRNKYLSIVAMLLPTNDGFVGLDSLRIPRFPGTYIYYLNGYDAGTESNDELITGGGAPGVPGIPADPGGNAGTGGTGAIDIDANTNTNVHIHPSVVGDTDPGGGISDLDSAIHRWQNPVAEVIIEVHNRRRR
ncbi:MAG: spondin domain-containing protein [Desulfobacterales bacterium]